MGDGVESSCSQIGVLPVRDGLDRPVDVGRGAFPVAPLFADFAGKSWECEFPRILAAYYDSFRFLGVPGLRYNDDGGNFVCSCSLLSFGGRRNAGSFDSVSCRGEGVGDGDGRGGGDATHCGATRRGDGAAGSSFVDAELYEDGAPKIRSVSGDRLPGAVVRGKHYESNKRKRLSRRDAERKKKEERMSGSWRETAHVDGVSQDVPTFQEFVEAEANRELVDDKARALEEKIADAAAVQRAKRTLAERWAAENELAVMKAKQGMKLLESKDLDLEVKKRDSYAKMQNERNLVNMEKAHQILKRTGNVPGFAQTVLSDDGLTDGSSAQASPNGCTISPDSSASMKEFRELAKKCADQQAKLDQFHKMTKIHPDYIELYKKQTWTINSENIRILDEMYPQGHALNPIPDYENYDAPTHGELIVGRDEEYFPY